LASPYDKNNVRKYVDVIVVLKKKWIFATRTNKNGPNNGSFVLSYYNENIKIAGKQMGKKEQVQYDFKASTPGFYQFRILSKHGMTYN
jgi:hypothetical protein